MTRFLRVCLWVLLLALIRVPSVSAQSATLPEATTPPAHLSLVEGNVSLDREGRSESAVENVPLLDGDRIRTEGGRAEIILGDGSILHLDRSTTAELLAGDLIRLLQGRIIVVSIGARDPSRAVRYQIDTPSASVQTNGPGEYRLTAAGPEGASTTQLAVVRGSATLGNDAGSVEVRAGERSVANETDAPSRPQYFNSARADEFDRWSANRRDEQIGTTSSRYLPEELGPYSGTFDRYGTWRQESSNGYVWFPRVSTGWRPYSVGYWRNYDNWDSFWVARDPWGWPTHHYGRWGFSVGLGWYWIPARSWASAFVYWALGGDYVSWCPLGWNDSPVFGNWGLRGVYVGLHDGWRGWTVIPRRHFGSAVFASHIAIDGRHLDGRAMSTFVVGRRAPSIGRAVARSQATARLRTPDSPTSRGTSGIGARGRGERAMPRTATPEPTRADMRGMSASVPRAQTRPSETAPTVERYNRRSVPGAPTAGSGESGVQSLGALARQGSWNSGRRSAAPADSGGTARVDRRRLPEVAVPSPIEGNDRSIARQRAPLPRTAEGVPGPASIRPEPRYMPRDRSMSSSSPAAEARALAHPPGRPTPEVSSGRERNPSSVSSGSGYSPGRVSSNPSSANPGRGSSSEGRSSGPSSRYNSGSATQRPPSRGTSSQSRGRGGAPG